MSLCIRLKTPDGAEYQMFGDKSWPVSFEQFLYDERIIPNGDFDSIDPTPIDAEKLLKWLDNYAKDLYLDLLHDQKPLLPIAYYYDPNDPFNEESPLTFGDYLTAAVDSANILEFYLVKTFLASHNIAEYALGTVTRLSNYDQLTVCMW